MLRRHLNVGTLDDRRADLAIDDLAELPLTRYPHLPMHGASGGTARTSPHTTLPTSRSPNVDIQLVCIEELLGHVT